MIGNLHEKTKRRKTRKFLFTAEEDQKLIELVSQFGVDNWSSIASHLPNRSPRQCRERWSNYLDPAIVQTEWTAEEDASLLKRYQEIGPHWKLMAQYFPGRSINSTRNRCVRLLKPSQSLFSTKSPQNTLQLYSPYGPSENRSTLSDYSIPRVKGNFNPVSSNASHPHPFPSITDLLIPISKFEPSQYFPHISQFVSFVNPSATELFSNAQNSNQISSNQPIHQFSLTPLMPQSPDLLRPISPSIIPNAVQFLSDYSVNRSISPMVQTIRV